MSVIIWHLNWAFGSFYSASSAYQKWPTMDSHLTMSGVGGSCFHLGWMVICLGAKNGVGCGHQCWCGREVDGWCRSHNVLELDFLKKVHIVLITIIIFGFFLLHLVLIPSGHGLTGGCVAHHDIHACDKKSMHQIHTRPRWQCMICRWFMTMPSFWPSFLHQG